jgi:hypothetical protein
MSDNPAHVLADALADAQPLLRYDYDCEACKPAEVLAQLTAPCPSGRRVRLAKRGNFIHN